MKGMDYSKPYTFDRVVRLVISVLGILFAIYIIYYLRNALLPFLIAWLFAYMLNPTVQFIQKKTKMARGLAVILTLVFCFGFLILLGFILYPIIQREIVQINQLLVSYDFQNVKINGVPFDVVDEINKYIAVDEIRSLLTKKNLMEALQQLTPAVKLLVNNTLSIIIGLTVFFMICLYLIFILLDYDKISELWKGLIPPRYRAGVARVTADVESTMNNYFRHQFLICCILATLYATGFQIIGLPMAIVFGIMVGFVHMIPYLQVISFPPALLFCWLASAQGIHGFWQMIGLVILVYLCVQVTNDLFLVPRIMGKAMGLNPAIILLSLSVWGTILGFIGMIIALPITTLILSYYKEFLRNSEDIMLKQAEKKLTNENIDK